MALYDNPTEAWQIRANETGMDVSNPSTWGKTLDPSNPWYNHPSIQQMHEGYQKEMQGQYAQNNPAPALNLVQDANGFWSNTNADANQEYMRNMLGTTAPLDPVWGDYGASMLQPGQAEFWGGKPPPLKLVQDANGNWSNANADLMQAYTAMQMGTTPQAPGVVGSSPTTPQTPDRSEYDRIAFATLPQATYEPTSQSDLDTIAANRTSNLNLQQNAQGQWFNPAAQQPTTQSPVDLWLNSHPNGPRTPAEYEEFNKLNGTYDAGGQVAPKQLTTTVNDPERGIYSWMSPEQVAERESYLADQQAKRDEYVAGYDTRMAPWRANYLASQGINVNGLINDQKQYGNTAAETLGNVWDTLNDRWASKDYVDPFQKTINTNEHILGNLGDVGKFATQDPNRWIQNAYNNQGKAQAASGALKTLITALAPNSGATKEEVAALLGQSGLLDRSFGPDYHAGQQYKDRWNNLISQALGGYDYAGELKKAQSYDPKTRWQSTLNDIAEYLTSPNRKLDSGALSQLAKNVGSYWGENVANWDKGQIDFSTLMNDVNAQNKKAYDSNYFAGR